MKQSKTLFRFTYAPTLTLFLFLVEIGPLCSDLRAQQISPNAKSPSRKNAPKNASTALAHAVIAKNAVKSGRKNTGAGKLSTSPLATAQLPRADGKSLDLP